MSRTCAALIDGAAQTACGRASISVVAGARA
ncbi:hypothetical protein FHS01_000273 [Longimicrobium terrae]|uniref:Uncharacterized protein n=1 Tax=Longimicrobium terrae TaxID=1639882 RepID=A0A841GUS9_9BACT|nr:hypothetical protein [Longimicrobium terrae]MBB6068843.1 hypothetical protein [Longimicrobium terrae]